MRPLQPKRLMLNVGRRIAEMRAERELTQEDLAERLDVSVRWLASVEAGNENLTLETLARVANALRGPVAELFAEPRSRARPGPGRPKRKPAA